MRNCRGVFPRFRNRATVFLDGSGVGGIALSSPHSDNTTFFLSLSVGWFHDWSVFLVIHWLCYSLWLFRLHSEVKLQPLSPVFPLAGSIAKGKTGEKGCMSIALWRWNNRYNRAFHKENINCSLWRNLRIHLVFAIWDVPRQGIQGEHGSSVKCFQPWSVFSSLNPHSVHSAG